MRVLLIADGSVQTEIRVFPDQAALNRAAADEIERVMRVAVENSGGCRLALAGGSTPKSVYALLAQDTVSSPGAVPWDRAHLFFGDERLVPADHPDSNYRMAWGTLLSKVGLTPAQVHRVRTEHEPATAALLYEEEIRRVFGTGPGEVPRFDLILLGMGPDGHTASLFPGTAALDETRALVCANWVERLQSHRITLTFPALNAAAEVLFLVAGAEKAAMLGSIFRSRDQPPIYPVQRVGPNPGRMIWMVDEAAAEQFPP